MFEYHAQRQTGVQLEIDLSGGRRRPLGRLGPGVWLCGDPEPSPVSVKGTEGS